MRMRMRKGRKSSWMKEAKKGKGRKEKHKMIERDDVGLDDERPPDASMMC